MLGVDAIFRIAIQREPGYAMRTPNPERPVEWLITDIDDISMDSDRAVISAVLYDGLTGLPLWGVGKPEMVNYGYTNEMIARKLVLRMRWL